MNESKSKKPSRKTFWSTVQIGDLTEIAEEFKSVGLKELKPTIRSSGIADYRDCPRKFMYRYRLGLKPRGYQSATTVGTYFHEAMAAFHLQYPVDEARTMVEVVYRTNLKKMQGMVNPQGLMPWGDSYDSLADRMFKDYSIGLALAVWAWNHDPIDFAKWSVPKDGVEKLMTTKIGVPVPARVRADALLVSEETGGLYLVDHKTTGMNPVHRAATLMWDPQPRLYALVLQQVTGRKVEGVIHNIVSKPRIRQRVARQPETFDDFLQRLTMECESRQADWEQQGTTPTGPVYLRSMVRFSGSADEELMMTLREISLASNCRVNPARFVRNAGACFKYNQACPFMDLCGLPIRAWKPAIEADYETISRDEEDERSHGETP